LQNCQRNSKKRVFDVTSSQKQDHSFCSPISENDLKKILQNKVVKTCCTNLNELAKKNKLDPTIGINEKIDEILHILLKKKKNNPLLLGMPGVGKTTIVEGLVQKIVKGDVPDKMKSKVILSLDMASLIAGTVYRGQFEERFSQLVKQVFKAKGEIILFIDEVHTIVGAGSTENSNIDLANLLKPYLSSGKLQIIAATTFDEYQKYFESDKAIERRFQIVSINEPTPEITLHILEGLKKTYESYHRVTITNEAIKAAVYLSQRYIPEYMLPDKAINLIDLAATKSNIDLGKEEKKIKKEDIALVVSKLKGIPLTKISQNEQERLLYLEKMLKKRVVGQDEAICAVVNTVYRSRVGLQDPKRPCGSFLFCGPTGVGKTELAKVLAESLFDDENALIRIDMSEYQDPATTNRLIGSPPGTIGYQEGGQLTEKIRRKPYSIVLLDEIEKAHPNVLNLFLQVLDDGILTDNKGRIVNFKNTFIIMTTNVGSDLILKDFKNRNQLNLDTEKKKLHILSKVFRQEFLARFDEIIFFFPFSKNEIKQIINMNLKKLQADLKKSNYFLKIDESLIIFLKIKFDNLQFDARKIKTFIKNSISNALTKKILKDNITNEVPRHLHAIYSPDRNVIEVIDVVEVIDKDNLFTFK
jgi:ATP-dependent Clp protease ATP-binding subunit ClpC